MRRLVIFILLVLLGKAAESGDSLRCGSRIVATGALAAEILGRCGEPDYRDRRWIVHPYRLGIVADVEEWYYNFGPSQLLRILRLRNGRLVSIDTDGYGYAEPQGAACEPSRIVPGLSKYRLLLLCGEPATRESLPILAPLRRHRGGEIVPGYVQPVFRERWVYNFGERYLLRVVTLENGRVTEVATESRGYE